MKVMDGWKLFIDSLGTSGGSLLLLTIILFMFFPLLVRNDSEGWKAAMFILGAIAGLINGNRGSAQAAATPPSVAVHNIPAPTPNVPPRTSVIVGGTK